MDNNRSVKKYCIKDANHRLLWANKNFLVCIGAKSLSSVRHLTDYDLPWQEYATIYHQHEIDTLSGHCYSTLQPVKDINNNNYIGLITKNLVVRNNVKTIHTSFAQVINLSIHHLVQTLLKQNEFNLNSFSIGKQTLNLSSRESECLFYLLHGKTSKIIAKILNISPRTVEQYFENIKVKLNCHTKSEIIDTVLRLGLVNIIPSSLFQSIDKLADSLNE